MAEYPVQEAAGRQYGEFSTQASAALRALDLAVIAATWLFLAGTSGDPSKTLGAARHEPWLRLSLMLAVASLAMDAIHYAYGALIWQRLGDTIEDVLNVAPTSENTKRVAGAWRTASRMGFVSRILDASRVNTDALRSSESLAIEEARRVVAQLGGTGSATVQPTGSLSPDLANLRETLTRTWSPRRNIGVTRLLFWAKTLAGGAAGACLLVFCAVRLF